MAYFRKGLKKPLAPEQFGMAGAIAGQFVVGDGTLVGQGATTVGTAGKPKLILNGKAFTATTFTGQVVTVQFSGRPQLILAGKQVTVYSSSTALAQLPPKLLLNAKAVNWIVPVYAHMGRSSLILQGKAFLTPISGIVNVGKPQLLLKGTVVTAHEVVLAPTIPVGINLVPTTPQTVDLVPTTPQSRDLVPTTEEFR